MKEKVTKISMRKSLKKAAPYLIALLMAGVLLAFLDIRFIFLIKENIDTAFTGQTTNFGNMARRLIMVQLLIFPANLLVAYLRGMLKKSAMMALKKEYLSQLFNKNINEFNNNSTMKYMSILINDMNSVEMSFIEAFIEVILAVTNIIAAIYIVVSVNINILFLIAALFGIVSFISMKMVQPIEKLYKERSDIQGTFTAYIKEALSAFKIIKSSNLIDKVNHVYEGKVLDFLDKSYHIDRRSSWIAGVQQFLFMTPFAGLMVYMIYLTKVGIMTVGGVMAVANTMEKLITPINIVMEQLPKILSVRSIFTSMDESLVNTDQHEETIDFKGLKDKIEFKNVTFSYNPERKVFNDLNITLERGKKYLIMGPSGGGKSTFLKLLRKYVPENSGEILVDGVPLKDITKYSYFNNIATVEQQVFLFEDTLLNNLTLYKEIDGEIIDRAIEKAGLKDFVRNLSNGLNTMLYDNGKNISGGEKSRIAIARALITRADMMILDEPFASLDYETGREIEKTILEFKDMTVVNVTHVTFNENLHLYDAALKVENGIIHDFREMFSLVNVKS